jgi:hypothetical protein
LNYPNTLDTKFSSLFPQFEKKFGECRWDYIGLSSSILDRLIFHLTGGNLNNFVAKFYAT